MITITNEKNIEKNKIHNALLSYKVKLVELINETTETIEYIYGFAPNHFKVQMKINFLQKTIVEEDVFPICVDAMNELFDLDHSEKEAVLFPFGHQRMFQQTNLVHRLNQKLKHNKIQYSQKDRQLHDDTVWHELMDTTEQYYLQKPWKYIFNEQVIAIYDDRIDDYIFCSVLGDHHDLYGLSVYKGFNGLMSLHMSLTHNFRIEQLFQIHSSILVRFERQNRNEIIQQEKLQPPYKMQNGLIAQFTSYEPGYFPWQIDEKEAAIISLAIRKILDLLGRVKNGFLLPNYVTDDSILLIKRDKEKNVTKESIISIKQLMKKIIPVQITLSKEELQRLHETKYHDNLKVEFSLQYVNVPIQRLKGNRPFLPLSSVIANVEDEIIIYHNIYDDRLDYKIVQSEFLHMIDLLKGIPTEIVTDELTYHYVKPLLLHKDLPLKFSEDLRVTNHVNSTVSQYLTSTVE